MYIINFCKLSPCRTWKSSPRYPQGMKRLGYIEGPLVYPADRIPWSFQGGRVLQGLVWVSYRINFCKWSNGLIPLKWRRLQTMFFWVVGSNPTIHHNNFSRLSPWSNLNNALPGIPRKWNRLNTDRSARVSGRPGGIPPFRGGECLAWLKNSGLIFHV